MFVLSGISQLFTLKTKFTPRHIQVGLLKSLHDLLGNFKKRVFNTGESRQDAPSLHTIILGCVPCRG